MNRRTFALLASLLVVAAPLAAAERRLVLDPARTEVAFDLEATGHDVHGLFSLARGEVRFDPESGAASGEIVLDAASGETGNSSRDRTMAEEVLEAASFPEIRFVPQRLIGRVADQGTSEVTLEGRLTLHGSEHAMALPARVSVDGGHVTAETSFPIPYLDWGLHDPSVLFLRVARVVGVVVKADGRFETTAAATGGK
jgi:polyisoprenoid-binding protein YceI